MTLHPSTTRHGLWASLIVVALLASWAYAQAPAEQEARRQLALAMGGRVFSGSEIGFRAKGMDRGVPVLVPVVKVDGTWVEVQLGMPGIQRLTQ